MRVQPRSVARGAALALAGALAGYLLWKAYHARALVSPGAAAFVTAQIHSGLVAALGSGETSGRLLWVINRLVLALPGALLLGISAGIALGRVAHTRLLMYAVLAWPLGSYAYATLVIRVLKNIPEGEQVALWHFRGVAAVDSLFVYSPFFLIAYLTLLLAMRMRPHGAGLRQFPRRDISVK